MTQIVVFDDYPQSSENRLFVINANRSLRQYKPNILFEKTVPAFEHRLKNVLIDVVILDIMAAAPELSEASGTESARTGIELLKRCRNGTYGDRYCSIPIFMRTARGESHIHKECRELNSSGFFRAGGDDELLISALLSLFETKQIAI